MVKTRTRYADDTFADFFPLDDAPARPKDYLGRAIDDETLEWAKRDERVAAELRSQTHPADHPALDRFIGDMGKSSPATPARVDQPALVPDVQPTGSSILRDPGASPVIPSVQPTEKPKKFPNWDNPVLKPATRWEDLAPDPAYQVKPSQLDFQSPQHFVSSLETAMAAGHTDPDEVRIRTEAARFVASRLPPSAYQRLAEGRIKSFVSHATIHDLTTQWHKETGRHDGECSGWYDNSTGELVINGYDPQGTLAHELTHALDSAVPDGRGGWWQLSNTDGWKSAWRKDLQSGNLSDYATENEAEGFAEFGRLLWGTENGHELAQVYFRRAYAVFQQYGLI